jgi:hypothetical protein
MKMDIVADSKNDEFYTPKYAIEPLLKYIPVTASIWCPFDTEESNFVKLFRERGNHCIATHKNTGTDFLSTLEPYSMTTFDYVISNPPYSLKAEVFNKLFMLKIPFAMLVGVVGLFESKKRFEMFKNNDFEIMYFNKRIAYFKDFAEQKPSLNPPFSSVYITQNILPKKIVFEEVKK